METLISTLHSLFGYIALLLIAWACGSRGHIPFRTIGIAAFLQIGFAAIMLHTDLRNHIFPLIAGITSLLQQTALKANQSLLFIGVTNPEFTAAYGPIVALEIAAIIIFVAALSRILYHYRLLPWLIKLLSRNMQRAFGISSPEAVGVSANIFLGMTEAPLLIRPYIASLTLSELFCIMTAGMATIAGTVMVVYASMLSGVHAEIAGHLFTASVISAPAAIAVAKLMLPETQKTDSSIGSAQLPKEVTRNGLDAAARGATEGIQLFINIIAMLIAFIGLVALGNAAIALAGKLVNGTSTEAWSLQSALGYLLRIPAWLMGTSWQEAATVGKLIGLKTILNEFVAYVDLARQMSTDSPPLSQRGFLIASYSLCGFANFGSVAIMIGGIGGIAPERRSDIARLGLRSLIGGTVATMLTGCVVGLLA